MQSSKLGELGRVGRVSERGLVVPQSGKQPRTGAVFEILQPGFKLFSLKAQLGWRWRVAASLGAPAPCAAQGSRAEGSVPCPCHVAGPAAGAPVGAEEGTDFLCGADDAPWVAWSADTGR